MRREIDSGWLTRERALTLVLLIATAIAFYVCYQLMLPFLPALAVTIALVDIWRRRMADGATAEAKPLKD